MQLLTHYLPARILFVLALLYSTAIFSQDNIVLTNNQVIKGKVNEVGVDVIRYYSADNPDGPIYDVPKSQVYMIIYANGTNYVVNSANPPQNQGNTGNVDNTPAPVQAVPLQEQGNASAPMGGGGGEVTYQTFYDEMSPYGNWTNSPQYGYVWVPNVGPDFRPYATAGHWAFSEYGWTWVSDFPWGWAAFHYGRWYYDFGLGYVWIPDTHWGPAWVSWRRSEGYYGWAPLGPAGYEYPHERWTFCGAGYITSERVYEHYERPENTVIVYNNTRVIENNYVEHHGVRYVAGPQREEVEHVTHTTVTPVRIVNSSSPGQTMHSNGTVTMYHPVVRETTVTSASQPRPTHISTAKEIPPVEQRHTEVHPVVNNNHYGQGQPGNTNHTENGPAHTNTNANNNYNGNQQPVHTNTNNNGNQQPVHTNEPSHNPEPVHTAPPVQQPPHNQAPPEPVKTNSPPQQPKPANTNNKTPKQNPKPAPKPQPHPVTPPAKEEKK